MKEIEQLTKMANQIAENFAFHDDAVARTVDHLRRFWAPSMRKQLIEHARQEGNSLNSAVRAAVGDLDGA
jgi:formate dehydrogenase subunit delta